MTKTNDDWTVVNGNLMSIEIVENKDYQKCLRRKDGLLMGLYQVVLCSEGKSSQHLVLAENEKGAISQASEGFNWENEEGNKATAMRVPMLLRGWGHTAF